MHLDHHHGSQRWRWYKYCERWPVERQWCIRWLRSIRQPIRRTIRLPIRQCQRWYTYGRVNPSTHLSMGAYVFVSVYLHTQVHLAVSCRVQVVHVCGFVFAGHVFCHHHCFQACPWKRRLVLWSGQQLEEVQSEELWAMEEGQWRCWIDVGGLQGVRGLSMMAMGRAVDEASEKRSTKVFRSYKLRVLPEHLQSDIFSLF